MAIGTTATTTMQMDETTNAVSLLNGLVRFDGKFANQVQNPIEVPEFLHKLYITLKRIDPMFQMGDSSGTFMAMDAIPNNYNGCKEKFNLQVLPKGDHQHLMFAVNFTSMKPFGTLKRAAIDLLKRNSLFMNRHALDASILDVTTTGWILGAQPRFHSPTTQKERMMDEITLWWEYCPPSVRRLWENRIDKDPDGNMMIPDFYIIARSVRARDGNGHTITESAFLVVAPIKNIKTLTDLLEEVFQPTDDDIEDDADANNFIPIHLQRSDANTYFKLVQQHGQYLEDFQNVSIAGVHEDIMRNLDFPITNPADGSSEVRTLADALMLHPSITRMDPGSYVIPLGKWNLSTTKANAEEAKKWIDHVIGAMPVTQRCHTNFVNFPTVIRMQAPAPKDPSNYAKHLKPASISNNPPNHGSSSRGPGRTGRPFSQNPQEPEFPSLLRFENQPNPSSYAQAAASKPSTTTPAQNTASTQISTITSDILKGYENEVKSLRAELRADLRAIHEKFETRSMPTTTKSGHEQNNNNQDGQDQTQGESDTQKMLQMVLQKMDSNAADHQAVLTRIDTHAATNQKLFDTNQNRFDALDDQHTATSFQIVGINGNIEHLRSDNEQLKEANATLMERMDILEGTQGPPSPIRKFRRGDTPTQEGTDTDTSRDFSQDEEMVEFNTHEGQRAIKSEVGSDPTANS
jgi:hypothetical protein